MEYTSLASVVFILVPLVTLALYLGVRGELFKGW